MELLIKTLRGEDQVENSVPLMAGGISSLHAGPYYHYVAAIMGMFNVHGREAELEPYNLMRWAVNNITLGVDLDNIMESVSDTSNADSEVVGGRNVNNQMECRCC